MRHHMRKASGIRVLAAILVACFLFTSIISRSLDPFGLFKNTKASWIAKRTEAPLKPDSQLVDEEVGEEKSEKDIGDDKSYKSSSTGFPICLFAAAVTLTVPDWQLRFFYETPPTCLVCPLYLTHRSLLI